MQVWPSLVDEHRVVNLAMASPSGSALFEIDRDALVEFLQQTYLSVPTGSDVVTWLRWVRAWPRVRR